MVYSQTCCIGCDKMPEVWWNHWGLEGFYTEFEAFFVRAGSTMTRELQPCPQYLFLKVLSKTRSPIIFITKRILRQVSSVVTKSLSVCFHTKTDVDFVSYRRERMIQYSFKIEMHSHFVFRTAKYSKKRLQQNPVRNVFGSRGCQLFRHMGDLGVKSGLIKELTLPLVSQTRF